MLILALALALCAGCRSEAQAPESAASLYARGLDAYRAERFDEARAALERAQALEPENVGVNLLLGWTHWRTGTIDRARHFFQRAYDRDPVSVEAQTGVAFASLAQDDVAVALPLLERLVRDGAASRDVWNSLASAHLRAGQTRRAAETYRAMLRRDPGDAAARREFLALTGFAEYRDDLALEPAPVTRPAAVAQPFRARGDYLQVHTANGWRDVYLAGVNLGPARPGEYPSTVSREFEVYARWLREMAAMHANTVRVYTILPPAFYRALAAHNAGAAQPIWLLQEVWIHDEAQDLYEPRIEAAFTTDLRDAIDLLHGQAEIPYRPGSHFGLYTADVSRWVIGLAVGREVEPSLVQRTDARHPSKTSHAGRFVSLPRGTPTEAWFARMCDLAAAYEMERYHAQRPLTVVNWPPLDPLDHPAESAELTELRQRQQRGEPLVLDRLTLPDFYNDTDVVSLDIVKFRPEPAFTSGLFALYHVYQHWPDFLFHEPSFAHARDAVGANRYLGYLQALKRAHPRMPLLIGEYGLSTSLMPAHLHPDGWHNGGHTEAGQAALLSRFTANHVDARAAGSLVFSWTDEWWKKVADQFTADFEVPRHRDPLWFNVLDPEETFGILGYEPAFQVPLLRGRIDDWARAERLYDAAPGMVRGVSATWDYAYLYLRVDLAPGPLDWSQRHLWIALNTHPGAAGSRMLPGVGLRVESGVNFLLQFSGPDTARLAIAANYLPHHAVPGMTGETQIVRQLNFSPALADSAAFLDNIVEPNRVRFARDGRMMPALTHNRSLLSSGTADRSNPAFSDHALWHHAPESGLLEVRLPWALLYVTDPSSRQVLAGTNAEGVPQARATPGVSVAVLALTPGSGAPQIVDALPAVRRGQFTTAPRIYEWPGWDTVEAQPYFKPAYHALAAMFERIAPPPR